MEHGVLQRAWIRGRGHLVWTLATLAAAAALVLAAITFGRVMASEADTLLGRVSCQNSICTLESGTVLRLVSPDKATKVDLQARSDGFNATVTEAAVGGNGARVNFSTTGDIVTSNAVSSAQILSINPTCLAQSAACSASVRP